MEFLKLLIKDLKDTFTGNSPKVPEKTYAEMVREIHVQRFCEGLLLSIEYDKSGDMQRDVRIEDASLRERTINFLNEKGFIVKVFHASKTIQVKW